MAPRHPLPIFPAPRSANVDAIRKQLGGRASTEAGAGEVVSLPREGDARSLGVILCVSGADLHVWIASGVVRRANRADVLPARSAELEPLAADARVFGALREGERVRYRAGENDAFEEGTLVEKCRFGGLILRGDGTVMGVGFRRIWPFRSDSGDAPS